MKISLCMIVKDEENVLARCLGSINNYVDEIVITDTGSTDKTREIAAQYTDKIFSFPWTDDFAAARNFSFSKAAGDYLMWLDADDFVDREQAEKLPLLKRSLAKELPDVVMCAYDVAANSAKSATLTFQRERLVRREAGLRWQGRVHECIPPSGKIVFSDFRVQHLGSAKPRGARNLHIYQKWAAEEPLGGRDLFYYGRELYYNRLYTEAEAVLTEMLRGDGWYVNKIEACKILAQCRADRKDPEGAKRALVQSFLYGEPRAGVLVSLADLFRQEHKLREAIFWYEGALTCRDHAQDGDFEEPTARTLVPLLQLTCCYYELGEKARALECHKKAEAIFPKHPSVVYNKKFFGE